MTEHLTYRPELDGIRGLAILAVVAAHTIYYASSGHVLWSGGTLGVDLFFVLSGFLITSLLLNEWASSGLISFRGFYVRRARRLLPALVSLVLVAFIIQALTNGFAPALLTALVRVSYLANIVNTVAPNWLGTGFGHLWSLAEEEQFYFIWPSVLLVLLRRRSSGLRLAAVLLAAVVVVCVERALLVTHGATWTRLWNAPDTHADPVLLGCVAGVVFTYRLCILQSRTGITAAVAMIGMAALFNQRSPAEIATVLPLFGLGASVLLLAVMNDPRGLLARALRVRGLTAVGRRSYGLYLFHLPLLALLGVGGLPVAAAATVISYRYVEPPFRRRRGSHEPGIPALAAHHIS